MPPCPRGPVHADLFRDNVMFEGEELTGFFDFYFAGVDTWLFDLAVCLNDWCIDLPTGAHDAERATRMLDAYQAVRPLTAAERELLPAMLRAGALAVLDLAAVGFLPAARGLHAHATRPHALRARAAPPRGAPRTRLTPAAPGQGAWR